MKKLPLLVAATAVVAISIGVVTAEAVTSKNSVAIRLNEFNVIPTVQGARAGKVTFLVTNTGKLEHEFVVLKTAKPAGSLTSHGGEASEAGNVGEIGSVKPERAEEADADAEEGSLLAAVQPARALQGRTVRRLLRPLRLPPPLPSRPPPSGREGSGPDRLS